MFGNFNSLIQLQKYFKNELICVQYLEQLKWNGTPCCPKCGCEKLYKIPTRLKHPELEGYKDFQCSNKLCKKMFSVLTDSIFSGSKISLQVWFLAMYLVSAHKKGISSHQLARDLGITQKTAWFILHRIRASFEQKPVDEKIIGVFSVDETYIGGSNKNRHADKKKEGTQGRSSKDKTAVLGILQTGGYIRTTVIPDAKSSTLKPIIKALAADGSVIVTDEWAGYAGLSEHYAHVVVKHNQGQYKSGAFSPNNVENFWSHLNRGIYGVYHQVSPKHLQRYCIEFEYRFNSRQQPDPMRFENTVIQSKGKRLTYSSLIAKTEEKQYTVDEDGVIIE